jgi:hypothetical protein
MKSKTKKLKQIKNKKKYEKQKINFTAMFVSK